MEHKKIRGLNGLMGPTGPPGPSGDGKGPSNVNDTITFPRQLYDTNTNFQTPILPAGRYVVAFVYTFDFPFENKALNVILTIANADGNLSYYPPIQYVKGYSYTLSGLVSINTSRQLYAVVEIGSPMNYGLYGVFTYQSV